MTILALLAAAAATAVPPPVPVAPPPDLLRPPPPSGAHPHKCPFFPPAAVLNRVQGDTLMSFTVTTDGLVQNPVVATSSGNADLDAGATACVKTWKYKPAIKDGEPVAVPWQSKIHWIQDPWHTPLVEKQPAPACDVDRTRIAEAKPGAETIIRYQVATDGTVGDIALTQPSGDAALDKSVTDCMAKIRFEPVADADGKPIPALNWSIKWAPPGN
jgi:TonB family protein